MSGVMSTSDWAKYADAVNAYSDSVSNQDITWRSLASNVDRYGEGTNKTYNDITLKALVAYNVFRTWPVDKPTTSGIVDREYCHIYLNKAYLASLGYTTSNGLFDFDPEFDRFILRGLAYRPAGDLDVAQANTNPLFYIVILQREEIKTGTDTRP